ncbi:ankyrin repeat domain-containing protein [Shewanella sp. 202IG2-18]|uniref:ankyrin repeat domain-containing protein n=1 Tax=Parashewanella hymeniacidonis TaxID=2807618 RepID=UPI00196131A9|nr:ankyrin repeat domain-containing protein [Parashewanella hymeniacidonis]MBM7071659.1 ankyrin repeat domain-containing protein [Parashewanella hymeniacidonis]
MSLKFPSVATQFPAEIRLDDIQQPIPMVGLRVFVAPQESEGNHKKEVGLTHFTVSTATKPVIVKFYKDSKLGRQLVSSFNAEIEFQDCHDKCWQVKSTSLSVNGGSKSHESKALEYLDAKLNLNVIKGKQVDSTSLVLDILAGRSIQVSAFIGAGANLNCRVSLKNFSQKIHKTSTLKGFNIEYSRKPGSSSKCYCRDFWDDYVHHPKGACPDDVKHTKWGVKSELEFESISNSQSTPLHLAVLAGKTSIVALLINGGASPAFQDSLGRTPLHIVCRPEYKDMRQCLVSACKPGDLNIKNAQGMGVIHLAVELSDDEYVQMLMNAGADLNLTDSHNNTPIHLAVTKRDFKLVSKFAEKCELDKLNKDGLSPLHLAVFKLNICIIDKLLEAGADPYLVNEKDESAISAAVNKGDLSLLNKLLQCESTNAYKKECIEHALNIAEKKKDVKMMLTLLTSLMKLDGQTAKLIPALSLKTSEGAERGEASVPGKAQQPEPTFVVSNAHVKRLDGLLSAAIQQNEMTVIDGCISLINSDSFKESTTQFCKAFKSAILKTNIPEVQHLALLRKIYSVNRYENLIDEGRGSIICAITNEAPNYVLEFLFELAVKEANLDMLQHSHEGKSVLDVISESYDSSILPLFLLSYHKVQVTLTKSSTQSTHYSSGDESKEFGQEMTSLKVN